MRSSSYMVKLIRLAQKDWSLQSQNVFRLEDFTDRNESVWATVLQEVLEKGPDVNVTEALSKAEQEFEQEKKSAEEESSQDASEVKDSDEQDRKKRKIDVTT